MKNACHCFLHAGSDLRYIFGTEEIHASECDAEIKCRKDDIDSESIPAVRLDEMLKPLGKAGVRRKWCM